MKNFVLFILTFFVTVLWSEEKNLTALFSAQKIVPDGELNEPIWQRPGFSDFVQNDPLNGAPPTERTEVWVAFDEENIYIAARLDDQEPEKIIARLGRHDDQLESDWFTVALDPYFDRLSGFEFSISPAGSKIDSQLFNDINKSDSWNGIWEAGTKITSRGWQVEIVIPFSQLRFREAEDQVWGIDCRRLIKRKQERIAIVHLPRNESGYVSRFAHLTGIKTPHLKRVHFLLPYLSAKGELLAEESNHFLLNGGMDLKFSLKSNLILDLSVNPDFGQVEVDPAEINLSGFETFLTEKRPFFIEGANIFNFGNSRASRIFSFNWPEPMIFYSRRIGRAPRLYPQDYDEILDFPDFTPIITAAKISGKISNGLNLGGLSAFTARQTTNFTLNSIEHRQIAEPETSYNVIRLQKEFNSGSARLGGIFTLAHNLTNDSLANTLLPKNAFSFGLDGFWKIGSAKKWSLSGWMAFSSINGSTESIAELQLSRPHYFQRPDFSHFRFNPQRTSLSGWSGRFTLNKEKGDFIFNLGIGAISPEFNVNTLGFLGRTDLINASLSLGISKHTPEKFFRQWNFISSFFISRNFNWENLDNGLSLFFGGETRNYLHFHLMAFFSTANLDNSITRGGISLYLEAGHMIRLDISTDNRRRMVYGFELSQDKNYNGSYNYSFDVYLRYKLGNNFDLTISPEYSFGRNTRIWVENVTDPLSTETFKTRHIFATIDQKTAIANLRLNWTFNPHTSFQLYLQPLIGTGVYSQLKELKRAKSNEFFIYGNNGSLIEKKDGYYSIDPDGPGPASRFSISDPNFNHKSLRGTALFRWEFRPGSVLYLVWTQNRFSDLNPGSFSLWRDFKDMLIASGDNIIMLKFTYLIKI